MVVSNFSLCQSGPCSAGSGGLQMRSERYGQMAKTALVCIDYGLGSDVVWWSVFCIGLLSAWIPPADS